MVQYQISLFLVLCFVNYSFAFAQQMIPTVEQYFPDLKGDLTRLEWLHAVNSQSLLHEALLTPKVHMLEADVVLGWLLDGSGPMPVMAHPPANTSDLSLRTFVQGVIAVQTSTKKGIKLDFKSNEAYNASWEVLNELKEKFTFPLWLNADILDGPGNSSFLPLDPNNFIRLACQHLPTAPLSLGWTTAYQEGLAYTSDMLSAMKNIIEDEEVEQPVTLAVRAAFAALSEEGIVNLVNAIDSFQKKNDTTLTIWMSSPSDDVKISRLRQLMLQLGYARVALDVPPNIREELIGSASTLITPTMAITALAFLSSASHLF